MGQEERGRESVLVRTIAHRLRMRSDIRPYISVSKKGNRAVVHHPEIFEYIYRRWKCPETHGSYEFNIVISKHLVPHTYTVALGKEFR